MDLSSHDSRDPAHPRLGLSDAELARLIDTAGMIIVALDSDARIDFINLRGAQLLGYSQEEIIGADWFDLCVPEDVRKTVRQVFEAAVAGRDFAESYANEVVCRNGSTLAVMWHNTTVRDETGRFIRTFSIGEDITERLAHQQRTEMLQAIIEATPDFVCTSDLNGNILYANEALCREVGLPVPYPGGLRIDQLRPKWVIETVSRAARAAAIRDGSWYGQGAVLRADGSEIPVSQVLIAHRGPSGVVEYFSSVGRDITNDMEAQAEVAQLNEQLLESLRTQQEFFANMSHELRTPLNSIIGFSGILREGMAGEVNDEQRRQLDMVRHSAHHLLALINQVLDLSKIESGQSPPEPVEFALGELMDTVRTSMGPLVADAGIKLAVDREDADTILRQDAAKLEQILLNLIGNAVKYSEASTVRIRAAVADGILRVEVEDDGVGIPASHLSRLFDKFYQVGRPEIARAQGTGLGLAISLELARILGGDVTVESEEGRFTRATLIVPAVLD